MLLHCSTALPLYRYTDNLPLHLYRAFIIGKSCSVSGSPSSSVSYRTLPPSSVSYRESLAVAHITLFLNFTFLERASPPLRVNYWRTPSIMSIRRQRTQHWRNRLRRNQDRRDQVRTNQPRRNQPRRNQVRMGPEFTASPACGLANTPTCPREVRTK